MPFAHIERTLPWVVVSELDSSVAIDNVDANLAHDLAGLANVARLDAEASWALTVPFVVIFGLRYGIFTPTEAGAVIATYSLAVGLFVYGELKISGLWEVVTEAAVATKTTRRYCISATVWASAP